MNVMNAAPASPAARAFRSNEISSTARLICCPRFPQ
jgi:hypothetical protein